MRHAAIAFALGLALAAPATAAEIEIKMLNSGADGAQMVFEPAVVAAEIGDTIRFVPTDRGHNAATVKSAIPAGAESVNGRFNAEVEYEVTESGLHLFKCTPHLGFGMLALVVVDGDLSNAEDVLDTRMPRRAKDRLSSYLEEARRLVAG